MKIAFIWQGLDNRYKYQWRDGLYAAMKLLERDHEVKYFDFPLEGINEFNPDVVLYWEAPCTILGKDKMNYLQVLGLPYPKALLFAGGPIKREWIADFDLIFVESEINEKELQEMNIPWKRAFGVNTQIFKPTENKEIPLLFRGFMQATFAEWKRHELFAQALGVSGAVAGRLQEHDRNGYNECVKRGVTIFNEQPAEKIAELIQQSVAVVNTSSYWGGGQRCTLEAMACGVPVIVMNDSPKNAEYVEESGGGLVVEPTADAIRHALTVIEQDDRVGSNGYEYIQQYWTEYHYSKALLEGIYSIV